MKEYAHCPICGTGLQDRVFEGFPRKYCPGCGFVHYRNPLPATGAVVIENGTILLIQRGVEPGIGLWTPPSGFIESGESPESACLGELREETGLEGRIRELLGVYREPTEFYGDVLLVIYRVEVSGGDLRPGIEEVLDARYFPIDGMPAIHFHSFTRAIEHALSQEGERPSEH